MPVPAAEPEPVQAGRVQQQTLVAPSAAKQQAVRQQSPMLSQSIAAVHTTSSRTIHRGAAAATHTPSPAAPAVSPLSVHMSSSPVLIDIQTSVSPAVSAAPQLLSQTMTSVPTVEATETTSPIALAPTAAQAEAPTPTLVPRGSSSTPIVAGSPAEASPLAPVSLPQGSPRDILSSLQQMNLQSKPFDFAGKAQPEPLHAARESTPEPVMFAGVNQAAQPENVVEQTPEPFSFCSPAQGVVEHTSKQSPEPNESRAMQTQAAEGKRHGPGEVQRREQGEEVEETGPPVAYISRRTTDPYMQKKLRDLQV